MARTYPHLDVHTDLGGLFPWGSRFVEQDGGVRMAYLDEGPRDARVTFLLLHGNPTWGFLYRRFVERLATRYRVLVPDHVGFGRSDKPQDRSYYTLARHVENLTRLMDGVDASNVVPVIQDWGGPIGMGWALRHPDHVAGVVVLNTWAFVREPAMKLPWLFKFLLHGRGGWRRIVRKNFFTEWMVVRLLTSKKLDDAEKAAYRAPHPRPEHRVGVAMFPRMIPQTDEPQHPDWATMAGIEDALDEGVLRDQPALIVWAMKDPAFRKPHLERWAGLFRSVDGPHRLPEANHYLQEDEPDAILDRIEPWAACILA